MSAWIGISGWRYDPWRGVFYPEDLPQKKELWFASRKMNSIEINGSFYALQRPTSFQSWYEETPENFCFSVKGNRYITHVRRLRDVHMPVANFFGSGILFLREKLGPILWQFPPSMPCDIERFAEFFKLLPRDTATAAHIGRTGDRVKGEYPPEAVKEPRPVRHAVEIRNPSFENPEFIDLLRAHDIALVFADTAGLWPYMEDVTSDFIYCRLHGEKELYRSGYGDASLDFWAKRVKAWAAGGEPADAMTITERKPPRRKRDVYVYFDNDVKVHAPEDAQGLARRLGI